MPKIILENINKRWGKFYAVDHLDLEIEDRAFVTLLGPSGCGKTTTLRMIAGLETPTSGRILFGDTVVFDSEAGINVPANKRKVGFLFQNYALWPNMTVYQNIAFGLSNIKELLPEKALELRQKEKLAEIFARPDEILRLLDECRDKKGQLDAKAAEIRLIDRYSISGYTARDKILKAQLDKENCREMSRRYAQEAAALRKKFADEGKEISEHHELLRDGQPILTEQKLDKEEIDLRVREVARIVKIGMFMERYPSELSGGQQQRVAIARTLAPRPNVLFMDEPLSNLDAKLRLEMRSELQRLHLETGSSIIYVTHDQLEAMTLATRICLLENGLLQQYDRPLDVYNQPANLFVADFVGSPSINFIEARGEGENDTMTLRLFDGLLCRFKGGAAQNYARWLQQSAAKLAEETRRPYEVEKANKDTPFNYRVLKVNEMEDLAETREIDDKDFVLGIRPESLQIISEPCQNTVLRGEIYSVMPTGMETTIRVRLGNYLLTAVVFGGILFDIGQTVGIGVKEDGCLLFHRKSGRLIARGDLEILAQR